MTNQHFFEKEPSFIYVNFSQKFAKKFQYAKKFKKFKIQRKIPFKNSKIQQNQNLAQNLAQKFKKNSAKFKISHKKFEKI